MMRVLVTRVSIPAMSTIGFIYGLGPKGEVVIAGDHRTLREIGEALEIAEPDEPVFAIVEDAWQVIAGEYDPGPTH